MSGLIEVSRREGIAPARAADLLAERRLAAARSVQNIRRDVRIVM